MKTEHAASPAAAGTNVAGSTTEERLRHLFRASLKLGLVHPLYLPLLQYRQAKDSV